MRISAIIYFLLIVFVSQGQAPPKSLGSVVYQLIVVNSQNQRLENLEVKAIEQKNFQETKGVTNKNGELILNLLEGQEWVVSVGEIETALRIKAVLGSVVQAQKVFVYDIEKYKREKKQDITRTNQGFQKIIQNHHSEESFPEGQCILFKG